MARRATLRLPVSAGEMRARLYAANLVLAERIADDGAFEIDTELSEFELLKWAREPGVEVLALDRTTQLVRPQVPTYNRRPPCEAAEYGLESTR